MHPLGYCFAGLGSLALVSCALIPSPPPDQLPPQTSLETVADAETSQPEALPGPSTPIWQDAPDGLGRQHVASGYICPAETDSFSLMDVESFPGLGRGNDVACVYSAPEGGNVKLHLTHFGREVSPSAHLKGVQTSLTESNTIVGDAAPPALEEGAVAPNAAAYQIAAKSALRPDIPIHTAVWIQQVNGWHIKARATYEADRQSQIGQLVGSLMNPAQDMVLPQTPAAPPQR